jgi:diadenosine tetraphosphate (Ap4A) HIT family hydrolase
MPLKQGLRHIMRALPPEQCPFCQLSGRECVLGSDLSFAILDAYPVNPGHLLLIPRRHVCDFFDLCQNEIADLMQLLWQAKEHIVRKYHPDGLNVGINVDTAGGQTISHVHIHLIPRFFGDVEDPTGGVRGVIPWKSKY